MIVYTVHYRSGAWIK